MRARYLAFLLWDALRGFPMRDRLKDLGAVQMLDPERLAAWQNDRLFRLLSHARDTTDFYRRLIPRSVAPGTVRDVLSSLPIVTREEIRAGASRFLSSAFPVRAMSLAHTSGSTGTPLAFWRDRGRSRWQRAEVIYFGGWAGYQVGMRYLYVGPHRPRLRSWLQNERSLWSTHPDLPWLRRLDDVLDRSDTQILIAHPSVLIPFAQLRADRVPARSARRLRGVISISEPLSDRTRADIERALGCPVLRRYSTNETGIIASECEEKRYHVNVGSCFVEYLPPENGCPDRQGAGSRVIVTALHSYGMPFIRYDVGDIAIPEAERCRCGRLSPLLREIEGRALDAITTPDGRRVEAFHLCAQFDDLGGVARFQFVQRKDADYRVRVVPSPAFTRDDELQIARRCRAVLGAGAQVVVERVDRIEPLPSGKTPVVVRESSGAGYDR